MSRSIELLLAAFVIGYVLKGCANSPIVYQIDKLF